MAKGSVRKKGRKWYYRFYIEDESGRQVQKEFAGTESKSETEALLRKAMEDYEAKRFVGKAENIIFSIRTIRRNDTNARTKGIPNRRRSYILTC